MNETLCLLLVNYTTYEDYIIMLDFIGMNGFFSGMKKYLSAKKQLLHVVLEIITI